MYLLSRRFLDRHFNIWRIWFVYHPTRQRRVIDSNYILKMLKCLSKNLLDNKYFIFFWQLLVNMKWTKMDIRISWIPLSCRSWFCRRSDKSFELTAANPYNIVTCHCSLNCNNCSIFHYCFVVTIKS